MLQSASQSNQVRLCAVATNTEQYESSLVCLLTEDTVSALPSASVSFFSLCISLSLPPQLCFGVTWPVLLLLCLCSSLDVALVWRKLVFPILFLLIFSISPMVTLIFFCLLIAIERLQCTCAGRTPMSSQWSFRCCLFFFLSLSLSHGGCHCSCWVGSLVCTLQLHRNRDAQKSQNWKSYYFHCISLHCIIFCISFSYLVGLYKNGKDFDSRKFNLQYVTTSLQSDRTGM